MVKLESIQDFYAVTRALMDNNNSKPHEYTVKPYGYCTVCKAVVPFEFMAYQDWLFEKCLSCDAEVNGLLGETERIILMCQKFLNIL